MNTPAALLFSTIIGILVIYGILTFVRVVAEATARYL